MRVALLVLLCACSGATAAPAPAPEGSHTELLRARPAPGFIAALDDEVRRLKTLARRADDPGLLLLRLAESLVERASAHGRAELRASEAGFEHPAGSPAREAAEARASRHGEARLADLTRARRVLEAIDGESPEGVRAREALFWLLAERREWAADSIAAARAIVATRSTGPLLAAAHLRLAEAAFVDARLEEALGHYEAVLTTEGVDGQTAAFASYKRAWVLLNLQRFQDAERAFARTLELARALERGTLAREAAKDRLRVHIPLRTPAPDVLTVIEESTDDPALRATLVERYEQMLRDAGQLDLAEAFRRHVLR